jgi:hypothetical protein
MMNYTDPPDAKFAYNDKRKGYILKANHPIKKG